MILKNLRFRNFFSSGNAFIEIDILKYMKAVISGSNGNGKSTIANAITFVLFGKTIKNVTKPQIVNSINGKNCVVEAEFDANNHVYKIIRGIKPNIFEIYENGVLIDQSSVLDYQNFLEEKILKCSYRTFLQTSIISIENYTPFMSLPKAARREFIEDILDIRVFSTMNQLVKSKVTKNKEELRLLEVSLKATKDRIILQKSHIDKLEEMKKTGIDALDNKLKEYTEEIESVSLVFKDSESIENQIYIEKAELRESYKKCSDINNQISGIQSQIRSSVKDIAFFTDKADCPTCRQEVSANHAKNIIESHQITNAALEEKLKELNIELDDYADHDSKTTDVNKRESNHNSKISLANSTIARLNRMISDVSREKTNLLVADDIQDQREAMTEAAKGAMKLRERQLAITEEQSYNAVMLELFKDTGIKSKIVDQYIPIINTLVNQYLEKLDFFVSFNLNSEFVETIKSRHRDDFSYASFSAGEKIRIDLALLFTFRQLAKMRNSFSCNLLLLDEVCDASADSAGIESLIGILQSKEFADTNIMVISHGNKERFEESFDGLYEVFKRDGFTCLR